MLHSSWKGVRIPQVHKVKQFDHVLQTELVKCKEEQKDEVDKQQKEEDLLRDVELMETESFKKKPSAKKYADATLMVDVEEERQNTPGALSSTNSFFSFESKAK